VDVCQLGLAGRLVIPPWCVRLRGRATAPPFPHPSASTAAANDPHETEANDGALGGAGVGAGSHLQRGLAVAAAAVKWRRKSRASGGGGGSGGSSGGGGGGGGGSGGSVGQSLVARATRSHWWRRGNTHRWSDYALDGGEWCGCVFGRDTNFT
jgi:hypothetical protein